MIRLRSPITVTVVRPAVMGRGGDRSGPDVTSVVEGCMFFADKSTENMQRRETVVTTGSLVVPRSADLLSSDQVIIPGRNNGKPFNIVGDPEWDQDSALSGKDFGFKWFQVEGVR